MAGKVERLTITLTPELAGDVRDSVSSGAYASSSEVIREALRDWRHKRQLRARELTDLRADINSGFADVAAERVQDFDAERIIERGRAKSADRSGSA